MIGLQFAVVALALAAALSLRPWRLLAGGRLLTPALASLVLLPWLWALPSLHSMPLQLQWSGACLVLLMLGGDAFVTGTLVAIFVAYRPHWVATWSDALSLRH